MTIQNLKTIVWDFRCKLGLKGRFFFHFNKFRSKLSRASQLADYLNNNKVRKLQIGSGLNPLKGWINTDINVRPGLIFMDATKTLPFTDASIDYIFSEHMFEHISYQDGSNFLCESLRILRSGGKIRIATPDLSFLIRLYNEVDSDLMQRYIQFEVDRYILYPKIYSRGNVINNFFYNWGHCFIYDYEVLSHILTVAGFTNVVQFDPRKSDDLNLQGLEKHGQIIGDEFNMLESIVVEATKP